MVTKIRRLKITVHTKEMMVLKHGVDHGTQNLETTELAICPVCHTPMKSLPAANQQPAMDIDIKAQENKSDK